MASKPASGKALEAVRLEMGLGVVPLWLSYFGLGGTASQGEMKAYLRGEPTLNGIEHDVLAQAINEYAIDYGMDHPAPYRRN